MCVCICVCVCFLKRPCSHLVLLQQQPGHRDVSRPDGVHEGGNSTAVRAVRVEAAPEDQQRNQTGLIQDCRRLRKVFISSDPETDAETVEQQSWRTFSCQSGFSGCF